MEKNRKNSTGKISYIFTRETFGMTLLLFSAIVMIMLFTRGTVFSYIGIEICNFMYGTFGYGSILIVALCAYLGEWLVFERSVKVKAAPMLAMTGVFLLAFLLFHAVSTGKYGLASYGGYISECYSNAARGWGGYTFGGALCALIVYPVAKFTTFTGAYIIFAVLLALFGYAAFVAIKRAMPVRQKIDKSRLEKPVDVSEEVVEAEPAPVAVNDHLYTVEENQEIVAAQPAMQTAAIERETNLPEDDKYSRKNLGRKILFESGEEFAAESYRRNLIFGKDSYFNNAVVTEQDYLSNFSANPAASKPEESGQSYTDSYQDGVLNEPAVQTPTAYVYGEDPVSHLNDPAVPYVAPEEQAPAEVEAPVEEPVREDKPQEADFGGESADDVYEERPSDIIREERPQESVEPAEESAEDKPSLLSSLFGDSRRGDRRGEDNNDEDAPAPGSENLFDDDNNGLFGVSGRRDRGQEPAEPAQRDPIERREEPARKEENNAGREENISRGTDLSSRRTADGGIGFGAELGRRSAPQPEPAPVPEEKPAEKPKHVWKKYVRPGLDLLQDYPENNNVNTAEIEDNKQAIVETLNNIRIACEISNVVVGPAITRYDVIIEDQLNIKRALNHKEAIAMALKRKNVNAYLNYSKGALSIEVPNLRRSVVGLKSMLVSPKFINSKPNSLTFGLGKNVEGEVICPDITKMPHLLVAGTTGSGKSICLSTLLVSLLYKYGPEELRLILVDPKQVEFISFDKLPHLMINQILDDVSQTIKALNWAIKEMERRYSLFREMTENGIATKNLEEYNAHLPEGEEKLPKVLIILDEFGDLMIQDRKNVEPRIIKLAQKSRACGIHLVLATQRPSVDCITGLIKSNLPTRIGFKVNSFADSSTIFDIGGAEKLLGSGDMYFRSTENPELTRIQGCYISSSEVQNVTDFIKANNETYFDQEVTDFINRVEEPEQAHGPASSDSGDGDNETKIDDTFIKALQYCVLTKQASVSMIQRRLPVGYIKACKIIDLMANMNYITQSEGPKPRKVLLSREEYENIYGPIDEQ